MSIRIGDKNKIKKSSIGHQYNPNNRDRGTKEQERFHEKHPVIFGLIISITSSLIVLFSFWEKIIKWIENIFKVYP
jgi:hypothetical protein